MPAIAATAKPRRSQKERSHATRMLLLDATIECLAEVGYARTTTARICERAGVSRGAPQHHFETHSGLLAEAVVRLGNRVVEHVEDPVLGLPTGPERTQKALDMFWSLFTGPLFRAVLELWVAAPSDRVLAEALVPVEQQLNRVTMRISRAVFADLEDRPDFTELMTMVLSTIRGLALLALLQPSADAERRWPDTRARLVTLLEAA